MFKKVTLLQLTKNTDRPGSECEILREKTGIWKFYDSKGEAERAYKRQKLFHKHGLGPKVFGEVIMILTKDKYSRRTNNGFCFLWGFKSQIATHVGCISNEEIYNLINKMRKKTKKRVGDEHAKNFGKIGGKWVLIDFGDCTFW